eukprot:scaffold127485_cov27-Phaeocystis_antarctica.AAC.1
MASPRAMAFSKSALSTLVFSAPWWVAWLGLGLGLGLVVEELAGRALAARVDEMVARAPG